MNYRSRWQQKRRERATRVRLIVIVSLLVAAAGAVLFLRGITQPAPSGYSLANPGVSWLSATPDALLVTTRDGELVKLTPELQPVATGWASPFTHPAGFWGRSVVAGDYVLVGCEDVRVRAIDVASGVQSWELEVGGAVPGISADGEQAYCSSAEPALYAFTAEGEQIWRTTLEDAVAAPPLVTEETVVVGTLAGSVCAYDRATGELRWRVLPEAPAPVHAPPAMGPSSILVGDDGGRLHSITREGELLASMQFEGLVRQPAAVSDAVVVAGDSSGLIMRVNPADMTEVWRTHLHVALAGGPIIVGDVVWCAAGRELVVLDAEDGGVLSRRIAEATSSDLLAAHGRIYWATTDGRVGAVATER